MKKLMSQLLSRAAAKLETPLQWRGPLVEEAKEVLTPNRVVSLMEAAKAWEDTLYPIDPVALRYESATLQNCANQNKARETQWLLVWCFGFSLRKQRERIDDWHLSQGRRYFDPSRWWLTRAENRWADLDYQGAYYLLDFSGRFGGMPWQSQEREIHKLDDVARAPEAMVAEAMITLHRTGRAHVLRDWYHWGSSLDSHKQRIYLGNLDLGKGFCIKGGDPHKPGPNLRVVLVRKWDF